MAESVIETLGALRQGAAASELDGELTRVVSAVRATAKAGKLQLTLTVKPAANGDTTTLVVLDDVKVTLPKVDRGGTIFYATPGDKLSRRDPRQPELGGLREAAPVVPLRDVNDRRDASADR